MTDQPTVRAFTGNMEMREQRNRLERAINALVQAEAMIDGVPNTDIHRMLITSARLWTQEHLHNITPLKQDDAE